VGGDAAPKLARRALIVAAAAGAAAMATEAASAAMPGVAAAADGDALRLGQQNVATVPTMVDGADASPAFGGSSKGGDGLVGQSSAQKKAGVYGVNSDPNGYGVFGRNSGRQTTGHLGGPSVGVEGIGAGGTGRLGTGSAGAYGLGRDTANEGWLGTQLAGVEGRSKTADAVRGATSAPQKSGVLGLADDPTGYGVWGHNTRNKTTGNLGGPAVGVEGISADAQSKGQLGAADGGVHGYHLPSQCEGIVGGPGTAVMGRNGKTLTQGGLGAQAAGVIAMGTSDHPGLQVVGGAQFSRAGILTIAKGKTSARATGVSRSGLAEVALAVLVEYRPGIAVAATVVDNAKGTVTVHVTKAPTADTKVAYFLFAGPPLV
jgi:hypothetical protein